MFMVLWSWPWSLREFTRFIWWMQTERRVAANPQTKPTKLACESAGRLPTSTSTSTSIIATLMNNNTINFHFYHTLCRSITVLTELCFIISHTSAQFWSNGLTHQKKLFTPHEPFYFLTMKIVAIFAQLTVTTAYRDNFTAYLYQPSHSN